MYREKFIKDELWLLTLLGAFQRAKLYLPNANENDKEVFRYKLKGYIENLILSTYMSQVSPQQHIENIYALSDFTSNFSNILNGGQLNFGVSQKLLNLYLKYNWVFDKIPTPPHFPVDSIIQKKLKLKPVPWTKMSGKEGVEQYLSIIEAAQSKLKEYNCKNVSELELMLFER